MLSPIEWTTLTTAEKKLHTAMRKSFVTSYAYDSEHILLHWPWKTLKKATKSFGPLLKVFAKGYGTTTSSSTDAWVSIFTSYPLAVDAITHKLLVSCLERCMSIPDYSSPAFTKYIAHINESLAQLDTVQLMSVTNIYALAALMGLHLSSSARYERATAT
jgi:hypothetical protein